MARCCAFLAFELTKEAGALVMTIQAPEGGEPAMHALVARFQWRKADGGVSNSEHAKRKGEGAEGGWA